LATATVTTAELRELCLRIPPPSIDLSMYASSSVFKAVEDVKAMQIDAEHPTMTVQIGASLNPK
jgi:hypothetical protein